LNHQDTRDTKKSKKWIVLARWFSGFVCGSSFLGVLGVLVVQSSSSPLVDLAQVEPSIVIDLRYATGDNVFGTRLYRQPRCLLRQPVAERLARVQAILRRQGLGLKVWDAYRPQSVQQRMWAIKGGSRYLASPRRGSKHSRGAAVDVTLVDARGHELSMPTGFDAFTARASRRYHGGPPAFRRNRRLLEQAMVTQGFRPNPGEWWHFDDPHWRRYPLLDLPL
jgi:D-alanyl-D-alanine dipeptidase